MLDIFWLILKLSDDDDSECSVLVACMLRDDGSTDLMCASLLQADNNRAFAPVLSAAVTLFIISDL